MIPQGYEITGDMVPRVRNILGVPDRRDTGRTKSASKFSPPPGPFLLADLVPFPQNPSALAGCTTYKLNV